MVDEKREAVPAHQLRVIVDQTGRKMVDKIFEIYVRREKGDYSRFPEFLLAVDRLVSEFGGLSLPPDEEDDHDADDAGGDDYEPDEDLHESSFDEVASMKRAVAHALEKSAIYGTERYDWYTWKSSNSRALSKSNGRTVELKKGTKFGIRPASSKKDVMRLVTKETGLSIVFSINPAEAEMIIKSSRPD
jgi:hypothetical protein